MKSLHESNDLSKIGINLLTGEACAYSMRILCDLNEDGLKLVRAYFGMPIDTKFNENWNQEVNGKPAVACIMLNRDIFPSLVRFAMFQEGYQYVMQVNGGWQGTGFSDNDIGGNPALGMYLDQSRHNDLGIMDHAHLWHNPKLRSTAPSVGDRNVHQFSGRVA